LQLDPADVNAHLDQWLETWTNTVVR
jgi:hypothetical protein